MAYLAATTFVELVKNFRFNGDIVLDERAQRIRTGCVVDDDINSFQVVPTIQNERVASLPADTLFIASTHQVKDSINRDANIELLSDSNPLIHLWAQHHKGKSKNKQKTTEDSDDYWIDHAALSEAQQLDVSTRRALLLQGAYESLNKNIKLLPKLELCIGSRVMYQNNSDPALGLFNGAMGTVVGFYYLENSDKGKATEKIPKYAIGPYNPFCNNALQAATHQYVSTTYCSRAV